MIKGRTLVSAIGQITATELLPPYKSPAQISLWFVEAPYAHPHWTNFMVSVVHLRLVASLGDAYKEFETAGYELLVAALNPEAKVDILDVKTWDYLLPINVMEQFTAQDDLVAARIGAALVERVVKGRLLLEPQGFGGESNRWTDAVQELKVTCQ